MLLILALECKYLLALDPSDVRVAIRPDPALMDLGKNDDVGPPDEEVAVEDHCFGGPMPRPGILCWKGPMARPGMFCCWPSFFFCSGRNSWNDGDPELRTLMSSTGLYALL